MGAAMQPEIGQAERLTEDDRAQAAAAQFVERALLAQRRAAESQPWTPGVCRNCGAECVGVYCDEDCKVDHERRRGRA